uniref:Uncharacterized protein n=1 Tax=Ditylenchus dipsaci TaxID=166011 RepID=A0A915E4F8_9BILA
MANSYFCLLFYAFSAVVLADDTTLKPLRAEDVLEKALGEFRSKVEANDDLSTSASSTDAPTSSPKKDQTATEMLEKIPADSIPLSTIAKMGGQDNQPPNVTQLTSETGKPIANFVVRPNEQKRSQKFEFMPHFQEDFYEFMIPEGTNSVESVMAVLTFYGHLNGPMPNFFLVNDNLSLFSIGDVSTLQEANYIQSSVPIMLKAGVNVKSDDMANSIYQLKVEAVQGLLKSECTVKVEVGKFQPPPPIENIELEPQQIKSQQEEQQQVEVTNTTTTTASEMREASNNSASLPDLVLANGLLATGEIDNPEHLLTSSFTTEIQKSDQKQESSQLAAGIMPEKIVDTLSLEQQETSTVITLVEQDSLATEDIDLTLNLEQENREEEKTNELEENFMVTDVPTVQGVQDRNEGAEISEQEVSTMAQEIAAEPTIPTEESVLVSEDVETSQQMSTSTPSTEQSALENLNSDTIKDRKQGTQTQVNKQKGIKLQMNGLQNNNVIEFGKTFKLDTCLRIYLS